MKTIKKLIIVVVVFAINMGYANNSMEDLRAYRVAKTTIVKVSPFCIAVAQGDFDTVKKLIELGEDVNELSNNMTPLMYASRYDHVEIIKLLVANGAKISSKTPAGRTAMDIAKNANANAALALLQHLGENK